MFQPRLWPVFLVPSLECSLRGMCYAVVPGSHRLEPGHLPDATDHPVCFKGTERGSERWTGESESESRPAFLPGRGLFWTRPSQARRLPGAAPARFPGSLCSCLQNPEWRIPERAERRRPSRHLPGSPGRRAGHAQCAGPLGALGGGSLRAPALRSRGPGQGGPQIMEPFTNGE